MDNEAVLTGRRNIIMTPLGLWEISAECLKEKTRARISDQSTEKLNSKNTFLLHMKVTTKLCCRG